MNTFLSFAALFVKCSSSSKGAPCTSQLSIHRIYRTLATTPSDMSNLASYIHTVAFPQQFHITRAGGALARASRTCTNNIISFPPLSVVRFGKDSTFLYFSPQTSGGFCACIVNIIAVWSNCWPNFAPEMLMTQLTPCPILVHGALLDNLKALCFPRDRSSNKENCSWLACVHTSCFFFWEWQLAVSYLTTICWNTLLWPQNNMLFMCHITAISNFSLIPHGSHIHKDTDHTGKDMLQHIFLLLDCEKRKRKHINSFFSKLFLILYRLWAFAEKIKEDTLRFMQVLQLQEVEVICWWQCCALYWDIFRKKETVARLMHAEHLSACCKTLCHWVWPKQEAEIGERSACIISLLLLCDMGFSQYLHLQG